MCGADFHENMHALDLCTLPLQVTAACKREYHATHLGRRSGDVVELAAAATAEEMLPRFYARVRSCCIGLVR